jgi:hypothetical protein
MNSFVLWLSSWSLLGFLGWLCAHKSASQFDKTRQQQFLLVLSSVSSAGIIVCPIDVIAFIWHMMWGNYWPTEVSFWQAFLPVMALVLSLLSCVIAMFASGFLSKEAAQEAARQRPPCEISKWERKAYWAIALANGASAALLFLFAWSPHYMLSTRTIWAGLAAPLLTGTVILLAFPWRILNGLTAKLGMLVTQLLDVRNRATLKMVQARTKPKSR